MPRLFSKKKKKKSPPPEPRSTRSFRVRADLQLSQQQQKASSVLKQQASTATTTNDYDSSSDHSQQQQPQQPYYRGGGYCSHYHRTYEERWSPEHVDLVVQSWNMTPPQIAKLMDLKERVKDVDHFLLNDPHQLVYFLKDEGGKVDLAEDWWREVAKNRTNSPFDHDTLCESYTLPDDYDYFPICVCEGLDKDGDPVHITRTGVADCLGLFQRHGRDAMIKHALYYQELDVRGQWMEDYEEKTGRKLCQYTVVFDLQGLSMRHVRLGLIPTLQFVSRLVQDSYPYLLKRALVIRAPSVFKMIWGLVKHFFDPELRELLIFATTDADSKQVMDKYIDRDVLPHVIHDEGKDGRVAKGYEHIVMEGGPLPPEGTYQTPQHAKEGRTRQEEEEYRFQEMGSTTRTSNARRRSGEPTNSWGSQVSVSCQCKNLLGGSYDPVSGGSDLEDSKVLIQITSGNRHLVGLN